MVNEFGFVQVPGCAFVAPFMREGCVGDEGEPATAEDDQVVALFIVVHGVMEAAFGFDSRRFELTPFMIYSILFRGLADRQEEQLIVDRPLEQRFPVNASKHVNAFIFDGVGRFLPLFDLSQRRERYVRPVALDHDAHLMAEDAFKCPGFVDQRHLFALLALGALGALRRPIGVLVDVHADRILKQNGQLHLLMVRLLISEINLIPQERIKVESNQFFDKAIIRIDAPMEVLGVVQGEPGIVLPPSQEPYRAVMLWIADVELIRNRIVDQDFLGADL